MQKQIPLSKHIYSVETRANPWLSGPNSPGIAIIPYDLQHFILDSTNNLQMLSGTLKISNKSLNKL